MKKYFYFLVLFSIIIMQLVGMESPLTKETVAIELQALTERIEKTKLPSNDIIRTIKWKLPKFNERLKQELNFYQLSQLLNNINQLGEELKNAEELNNLQIYAAHYFQKEDKPLNAEQQILYENYCGQRLVDGESQFDKDKSADTTEKKSQHPYWKKGIAYLGVSTICATLGLYAIIKLHKVLGINHI